MAKSYFYRFKNVLTKNPQQKRNKVNQSNQCFKTQRESESELIDFVSTGWGQNQEVSFLIKTCTKKQLLNFDNKIPIV